MEVTRKNFKESLPMVAASIEKADFLVIDAEFTGLINGRDVSVFDLPQEYYLTLLNGSTEFLLIQYGLCAFYWDDKEEHYMNDAYNFYLFPRSRPGPEKMFLCQSSSLDFLASQGFDFNKLIREGISYMTEPTETRLREVLIERQKSYSNEKGTIIIPEEHKSQIEDICKKVQDFLNSDKTEEMEIDRCNAFMRRLLFQELGARFKEEVFVETKVLENKDRVLKVTRLSSADDRRSRDVEKKEKEWEEFEDAVGFSKVARMISQSGKLVIGHNMLLDLLHTLNHFFQPLPSDYASFKEFAHCMFPRLLDTKYMSSLPPFKDKVNSSVLQHLLATLSEPPFALPKITSLDGRGYEHLADKQHEAGYDAYITGVCFLAMHAHLARMRGERRCRIAPDAALLKPFLNKLFLAKTAHQESPYINLTGADPSPSREHVFHITFPREWQRSDLNQLFSVYGQITLQFLDDTTALVALSRRDLAKTVMRAFASNKNILLVPYSKYKGFVNRAHTSLPRQKSLERRDETTDAYVKVNTPDAAQQSQADSSQATESPVKRTRSSSFNSPTKQPATTRKRTSSGVFQVEEAEPPPKKPEHARADSEISKKPEVRTNGRRKTPENEKEKAKEKAKEKRNEKKEKDLQDTEKRKETVIERFDSESKTQCVSAFKESDSWD
ncbi:poly(A)-specific ribonuclease PARN-like isoform X1 [Colias croceus]|uniref:poly(A)-specific ribonuclease PARN-like isoform X1 n=1 Tax=Colias crocea TaxID=72248 RepID=UPI001E27C17B|nr:poly(A)-specific ribonuclease PARN-like isoform X1 [Colias croceus]